jgi:hypothetical protein
MNAAIVGAIHDRHLIRLTYDGYTRTVEPHAYGVTQEGHDLLSAWQVAGGSVHNEPVGWKNLRLDGTHGLLVLDETFPGPRQGYNRENLTTHLRPIVMPPQSQGAGGSPPALWTAQSDQCLSRMLVDS